VMIRPRIMPDPPINLTIGIARPLCSKFPYLPFFSMFVVEEFDELIERIAVCALRVCAAGPRGCDDEGSDIAKIEPGFWMAGSWSSDNLAKERRHVVYRY